MKIVEIKTQLLDVQFLQSKMMQTRCVSPMSKYPDFAESRQGWMWPSKKVAVTLRTEEGIEGVAVTSGGEIVINIIKEQISRLILGRDAENIEEIWHIIKDALSPVDRSGFTYMSLAVVDIALWDIRVKAKQITLAEMLGGTCAGKLPCYITTLHPEKFRGMGYQCIKVPMPRGPESGQTGMEENLDWVKRARDAVDCTCPVAIDSFYGWDAAYTLDFWERSIDLEIAWFEDPLPPNDLYGYRELKKQAEGAIPIALGNNLYSEWEFRVYLDEGIPAIIQPDVAWAGGITQALKLAELAEEAGIEIHFHNTVEQPWAVQLSAVVENCPLVEFVERDEDSPLLKLLKNIRIPEQGVLDINSLTGGNELNVK